MKFSHLVITLLFVAALSACHPQSAFEKQIIEDARTKIGTGICDSIPAGTFIVNVEVGDIVSIGTTGLIDVAIEYDTEKDGVKGHRSGGLLYSKEGEHYFLEAISGCQFSRD